MTVLNSLIARLLWAFLGPLRDWPPLAGLTGAAYLDPEVFSAGFHRAALLAAGLTAVGGVLGWISLAEPTPSAHEHAGEYCCGVEAPPLRTQANQPLSS